MDAVKSPVRLGYYNFKRAQFRRVLGAERLNERWVWHGTTAETIQMIAHQGFLRQYMTESETGKGVNFVSEAKLASKLSLSDKLGMKRMFLCRALIGEFHQGYKGCLLPDPKPGKIYEVHESVVDSVYKPKAFVLYQDDQAYPEYCITFRPVNVESDSEEEGEEEEKKRAEKEEGKENDEKLGERKDDENVDDSGRPDDDDGKNEGEEAGSDGTESHKEKPTTPNSTENNSSKTINDQESEG
mmetsp:Transcript_34194/g.54971  ORF Transcript_34194/g.54971 Transcript_34194/m.54971 type:complete len:242 (+) Transcript_34194:974-1699(+)